MSVISNKELARVRRQQALDLLSLFRSSDSGLIAALKADYGWVARSLASSRSSYHERAARSLGWGVRDSDRTDEAHLGLIESALAKLESGAGHMSGEEAEQASIAVRRALTALGDLQPSGAAKLNILGNRRLERQAGELEAELRSELAPLEAASVAVSIAGAAEASVVDPPELATLESSPDLAAGSAPSLGLERD